uniref:tRNA (guanine-N(1)-)-methyltransferase n=1 Tax=Candidatus Aschnera chinzeii TaxID=1485666 RepID=A0AAT9G5B2_9ENTR|nr:MAG: tRNA (guanosine(37)-N1)-methyltransferase TrmD [Candidatus Aschnera chinzeii]
MIIGIITIFPEMFLTITKFGIISKAIKKNILNITYWNPRNFTTNKHRMIDDKPYGGGPGMLMLVQPINDAINAAKINMGNNIKVIYLSPQGRKLHQNNIHELSEYKKIILVCGRYKGIDDRLLKNAIDEEWSIGDYIITGGELAAMIIIDAIARLLDGTINNSESIQTDSFANGILDCPYFTRPKIIAGMKVPDVLLSGNHAKIKRWKKKQSLGNTWLKRPDLLMNIKLTEDEKLLLFEFQNEYNIKKQ